MATYIVRRADRRPLAVPEWMTRPEAAEAQIATTPRLPVSVLMALRSDTMTGLASCEQIVQEENPDDSAKGQTAATFRRNSPHSRRRSPAGSAGATPPRADAVVAHSGSRDAQGDGR